MPTIARAMDILETLCEPLASAVDAHRIVVAVGVLHAGWWRRAYIAFADVPAQTVSILFAGEGGVLTRISGFAVDADERRSTRSNEDRRNQDERRRAEDAEETARAAFTRVIDIACHVGP